jgi:hypothetical protein
MMLIGGFDHRDSGVLGTGQSEAPGKLTQKVHRQKS